MAIRKTEEKTDLFLAFSHLSIEAKKTFKDDEKFSTWLSTEWEVLNNKKPTDFLSSVSGVNYIIDLLTNIRHGIYA